MPSSNSSEEVEFLGENLNTKNNFITLQSPRSKHHGSPDIIFLDENNTNPPEKRKTYKKAQNKDFVDKFSQNIVNIEFDENNGFQKDTENSAKSFTKNGRQNGRKINSRKLKKRSRKRKKPVKRIDSMEESSEETMEEIEDYSDVNDRKHIYHSENSDENSDENNADESDASHSDGYEEEDICDGCGDEASEATASCTNCPKVYHFKCLQKLQIDGFEAIKGKRKLWKCEDCKTKEALGKELDSLRPSFVAVKRSELAVSDIVDGVIILSFPALPFKEEEVLLKGMKEVASKF